MKTICAYCGKELERRPCRVKERNYCNASHQMKYELENGIRNPKEMTKKAHEKIKQLAKEGKHLFQRESTRLKLKIIQQTPEYREKVSLAKKGKKNWMYGKKGNLHPNWSRVKRKCLYCGKIFYIKASQAIKGEGKYCSKGCYSNARSLKIKCLACGKLFKIPITRKDTAKFCSFACYGRYITGEGAPNWRGGKSFEPYLPEFNTRLKERIRERDNYQCQLCKTEINWRALPIHHIDYDKTNNEEQNLITLCDYCHKRTNFNRDYWKNYFKQGYFKLAPFPIGTQSLLLTGTLLAILK